jgi:hypothetical protein
LKFSDWIVIQRFAGTYRRKPTMVKGDTVKFMEGLYIDEKGTRYKVIEINQDNAVIELISDLPEPPQSIAKISELVVVSHIGHKTKSEENK